MDSHIDRIIQLLGYTESDCLKYRRDGFASFSLSAHTIRVLEELSPYAVYIVDNAPFALFFEESYDLIEQKKLYKKIWNAQIPLVFICENGSLRIYNGCSIDLRKYLLEELEHFSIESLSDHSPFSYWEVSNNNLWIKHQSYCDSA